MQNFFVSFFSHVKKAFFYSVAGLRHAYRHEFAFRWEIYFAIPLLFVGCYIGRTAAEKCLLCGSILLILIVELINTAIETTVNRISLERHALSAQAKDLGSAAVFIAILNAAIIWFIIILL